VGAKDESDTPTPLSAKTLSRRHSRQILATVPRFWTLGPEAKNGRTLLLRFNCQRAYRLRSAYRLCSSSIPSNHRNYPSNDYRTLGCPELKVFSQVLTGQGPCSGQSTKGGRPCLTTTHHKRLSWGEGICDGRSTEGAMELPHNTLEPHLDAAWSR